MTAEGGVNVTRNLKGGGLFPLGEINCTRDFHSIRRFFFAKHSSDPSQSWCVKCGVPRRYILKPDIRNDWQDQIQKHLGRNSRPRELSRLKTSVYLSPRHSCDLHHFPVQWPLVAMA